MIKGKWGKGENKKPHTIISFSQLRFSFVKIRVAWKRLLLEILGYHFK
jgi:hypothetical protein